MNSYSTNFVLGGFSLADLLSFLMVYLWSHPTTSLMIKFLPSIDHSILLHHHSPTHYVDCFLVSLIRHSSIVAYLLQPIVLNDSHSIRCYLFTLNFLNVISQLTSLILSKYPFLFIIKLINFII
jgi:hypothetical protein